MNFFLSVIIYGVALWVTSKLLDGVTIVVESQELTQQLLVVGVIALIFTIVTWVIRPAVKVLSLPLYILTLGLFSFVVSALMLLLTSWLADQIGYGLHIASFWWALGGGALISLISTVLFAIFPKAKKR